ncbi:SdpI family protein [uncultured Ruthenibacterium sp.]|uniref:SdpI family protein n=1 Tax=uncultured Ruthenibacterium sp. TaxID=1905347 RepID=UPI00349EDA60
MKRINRTEILIWILAILPLIACVVCMPFLPDKVPMHWGINGQIDRYGNRSELILLAATGLGIALLLKFVPRLDPKRQNYEKFKGGYTAIRLSLSLFYMFMIALTLFIAFFPHAGAAVSMDRLCTGAIGILFCIMGNFMPKFQHNYFCGIRVPWTLSSSDNWRRTHRFAGPIWFVCGLGILVCAFLLHGQMLYIAMIIFAVPLLVLPILYSYLLFRRTSKDEKQPPED